MQRKLTELLSPVPNDIDIAQAIDPLPITEVIDKYYAEVQDM